MFERAYRVTGEIDKVLNRLEGADKAAVMAVLPRAAKNVLHDIKRQLEPYKASMPGVVRGSSCGDCTAKNAFKYFGYPEDGRQVNAQGRRVFMLGDMTETMLVMCAVIAGLPLKFCLDEQLPMDMTIGGIKVPGHPDGLFVWSDTELELAEFKSMRSERFADFVKGEIEDGYLFQVQAYMLGWRQLGYPVNMCRFVAYNKNGRDRRSGEDLVELVVPFDYQVIGEIEEKHGKILALPRPDGIASVASIRTLRQYGPGKDGFLPWQCGYCSHRRTCWADHEAVDRGGKTEVVGLKAPVV